MNRTIIVGIVMAVIASFSIGIVFGVYQIDPITALIAEDYETNIVLAGDNGEYGLFIAVESDLNVLKLQTPFGLLEYFEMDIVTSKEDGFSLYDDRENFHVSIEKITDTFYTATILFNDKSVEHINLHVVNNSP